MHGVIVLPQMACTSITNTTVRIHIGRTVFNLINAASSRTTETETRSIFVRSNRFISRLFSFLSFSLLISLSLVDAPQRPRPLAKSAGGGITPPACASPKGVPFSTLFPQRPPTTHVNWHVDTGEMRTVGTSPRRRRPGTRCTITNTITITIAIIITSSSCTVTRTVTQTRHVKVRRRVHRFAVHRASSRALRRSGPSRGAEGAFPSHPTCTCAPSLSFGVAPCLAHV